MGSNWLDSNCSLVASKLSRSNTGAVDFARHLCCSHDMTSTSLFSGALRLEEIGRRAFAQGTASDVRNNLGTTVLSAGTNNVARVAARLGERFDEARNLEHQLVNRIKEAAREILLTMQVDWPGKSCAATRPATARRTVVNFMLATKNR